MAITHEYLKSILGYLTYTRSVDTFKAGKVRQFTQTHSERGTLVRATVSGAFPYKVEIDIPKDEDVLLLTCSCMAYEAFGRCKHIGAALLEKMKRDEEAEQKAQAKAMEEKKPAFAPLKPATEKIVSSRPAPEMKVYNNPMAALLLSKYASADKKKHAEDASVKLVPQLSISNGNASVGFTVGNERQYVVKDLIAFMQSMKMHETVTYGSKLTLFHDRSVFDEKSRRLLDLIEAFVNERQTYSAPGVHNSLVCRFMPLTGRALDDLFDLYLGEEIPGREAGQKWRIKDENPSLSLASRQSGSHIRLTLAPPAAALSGIKRDYCVVSSTIYCMTEDFAEAMLPLMELSQSGDFLFSPQGAMQFCQSILPLVEKHAPLKEADALEKFLPTKMDVRYYIDMPVRSRLTAQPFFIYNGMTLTPETPLSAHPEINRDRYRESAAVEQLIQHFDPPKSPGEPYHLEDEERMYAFLSGGTEKLSEFGEVYISDKLKNINVKRSKTASVGVSAGESVLNLTIDTGEFPG